MLWYFLYFLTLTNVALSNSFYAHSGPLFWILILKLHSLYVHWYTFCTLQFLN